MASTMDLSAVKTFASSATTKVTLAGAVALNALGANAQSLPFDAGKCYDGPTVEAAMLQDGQKPVFIGKRAMIGGALAGNVITMNDQGYGYNLEREADTKKLCLAASFKNAQLNYPDNPNIPDWGQSIKPSGLGIIVQGAYTKGGRLLFRGQTYSKDSNGKEVSGKAIVLIVGVTEKQASVWSVNSQNIPSSSFAMRDFGIVTTNFNDFMVRGFGSGGSASSNAK